MKDTKRTAADHLDSLDRLLGPGQGYDVLEKKQLANCIYMLSVAAPAIARKARAGQFIVLRVDEYGERIPLTLADWDEKKGNIILVYMEVGGSTTMLSTIRAGDSILDLVGPLGTPSHIENFGKVVCVAGGVGVAPIVPIAKALKQAGNTVISVIGARSHNLLFWEDKIASCSHRLIVTTDDGSYARKGVVTEPLKEILGKEKVALVVAIGPAIMMKFCAEATRSFGVKTLVSLNPIMVDGTGMCGCCRVAVGGKTKFSCVDGPEFDAHEVDWGLLLSRQRGYVDIERHALKDCKWRAFEKQLLAAKEIKS